MVNRNSAVADKIGLFRSLFRGREEVYAKRFESRRTGRSGYRPACAHEWIRGLCAKADSPRARCSACKYLTISDAVIHAHLTGKDDHGHPFVMGIYPMLLDETCFFLAIDFDKANWQRDVREAWQTCHSLDLPAAIEISRSGNPGPPGLIRVNA